jgi:hypothetical protein
MRTQSDAKRTIAKLRGSSQNKESIPGEVFVSSFLDWDG